MKNKTKKVAPSESNPTTTTTNAEPCIFTPADRKRLKPLLSKDSFDKLMALVEGDPMPLPLIGSDGNEIDRGSMDEIAIQSWHDGNEEYIYQLGKNVYAYYDDRSNFLVYEEAHVTCVIEYSYPREDGYWEEKCVQFKVKPPLRPAKRSCWGSCRVWVNTFYRDAYLRTGDLSGWAREENREIIEFESYSAARKWINQDKKEHHGYADIVYPRGHYLYAHNEYAPREYKICE